jgi:dTMP kinase
MKKGLFIVLDGNDGSGKATQADLLQDYFKRKEIVATKLDFPAYDRNFFGAFLGECLLGSHGDFVHMDPKIASSLYALDRLESSKEIEEKLSRGEIVLADRFSSSNQIHQGGKITDDAERTEFLEWLEKMEHEILSIPRPDYILYLKVPLEMSLKLLQEKRALKNSGLSVGQKDTVEEDMQYLQRSHETAQWLALKQKNWSIIDCALGKEMRSRESIHTELVAHIESLVDLKSTHS